MNLLIEPSTNFGYALWQLRHSKPSCLSNLELNPEQSTALQIVAEAIDSPEIARPILLHGVTGSGKTEIYLQAIRGTLKSTVGRISATFSMSLSMFSAYEVVKPM